VFLPVGKNLLAGLKQRPALTPHPTPLPMGEGAVVGEFMSRTTAGEGENRKLGFLPQHLFCWAESLTYLLLSKAP